MLKVGMLSYCNALPFSYGFAQDEEMSLWHETPNRLFQALTENHICCALTSSLHVLDPTLQPFTTFCIAAEKRVFSVNLYYKGLLSELNGKCIGIHDETTTSFALLRILCHYHWKIRPTFEIISPHKEYDAFLLIGDRALKEEEIPGYRSLDLAKAWYEMTGSPFVFALFFAKKGSFIPKVEAKLEKAFLVGEEKRKEIIEKVHREKKLSFTRVEEYYSTLRYRMGSQESGGLAQFLSLYRSLP